MSNLPPLSSTNWPNNPGCPNGQYQQMQLSASFPLQNTVPSLTAAAVRGTKERGPNKNRTGGEDTLHPTHGGQASGQNLREPGGWKWSPGQAGHQQSLPRPHPPLQQGCCSKRSPSCWRSRCYRQLHMSKNVASY